MSGSRQSSRLGRKTIHELDDGSLMIHFEDDNACVLVRWILELGKRTPQVALVKDLDHPLKTASVI